MFVRISTYFPFNARVCLTQHEWLARRLDDERVHFGKAANAIIECAHPEQLQRLADS
jgi:hypothetical protein